jgi:hypothetical protein
MSKRRLPQAGRIRTGTQVRGRSGKMQPVGSKTFIFTSQDPDLLAPVAARYGGTVGPWDEPKSPDRYAVTSETRKIDVILPNDPVTEWFELWSGKTGLERRCDGEYCEVQVSGPDGHEMAQEDCICVAQGWQECDYKLRLSMLIPEVSSLSTWRLDTSSEHARMEIPEMVKTIEKFQELRPGFSLAVLRLDQRTAPGRRFSVPVLDVAVSPEALMAGAARLGPSAVGTAPRELAPGRAGEPLTPSPALPPSGYAEDRDDYPMGGPDDDVEDAVVIDDVTGPQHVDPTIGRAFIDNLSAHQRNKALLRARDLALELGEPVPTNAASISTTVVDVLVTEYQNGGFKS